jgi:hypothetical protein
MKKPASRGLFAFLNQWLSAQARSVDIAAVMMNAMPMQSQCGIPEQQHRVWLDETCQGAVAILD